MPELLPSLMLAYRSFVATQSSQYSPFCLLNGRECQFLLDIALVPSAGLGRTINEYIEDFLEKLEFVHDIAKENIQLAQKNININMIKRLKNLTSMQDKESGCTILLLPKDLIPK